MGLSTLMIQCTDYPLEQTHELVGHVPSMSDSGQDVGRTSLLFSGLQAARPASREQVLPADRRH